MLPQSLMMEHIQLKMRNYKFGEGPDFIALKTHFRQKCKREYLNKSRDRKNKLQKEVLLI